MTMRVPGAAARPPVETGDLVVEAVRADLLARSQMGIRKYGTTLAASNLPLREWLDHAYQECLDQALYLRRAAMAIDEGDAP